MEHRADAPISVYREFAPSPELRDHVRALAWFGPAGEPAGARAPLREFSVGGHGDWMPTFADTHASLLFGVGFSYWDGRWQPSAAEGMAMGAVTRATPQPQAPRSGMVAVYLRPQGTAAVLGGAVADLTDRVVALGDLWKGWTMPERATIDWVEALVARRLQSARMEQSVRIAELASWVNARGGRVSVSRMADAAGVSRQHLARLFREYVGVGPKLHARLARFRTGLRHLGERERAGGWSRFAAGLGYADQSHFIAEFREFTTLTPAQLASGGGFHPFIGDETESSPIAAADREPSDR